MAAAKIAEARPAQSYIVTLPPLVLDALAPLVLGTVTALHTFATIPNASWLPVRVSPGRRMPWEFPVITQRRRPDETSMASHWGVTELSRPEKPPSPATSAFEEMIAAAALLWLETPTVPPP